MHCAGKEEGEREQWGSVEDFFRYMYRELVGRPLGDRPPVGVIGRSRAGKAA